MVFYIINEPVTSSECFKIISAKFILFLLALQPPLGVVFYSPLAGFSLLAYEVF